MSEMQHQPVEASAARVTERRALVIGASSGIGAALVRRLARDGWSVCAVARRGAELESLRAECAADGARVFVRTHDARATDQVPALLSDVLTQLGGLDLFVYCAGVYHRIGDEEYDSAKDLDIVAVNVTGCIAWTNAAAAILAAKRAGTIVGLSSVAGDRGRRSAPVYGATKAFVNHYFDSLRFRLRDNGVHVCTIRPGHVSTPMVVGLKTVRPITPERAADEILAAIRARADVRYVPRWWGLIGLGLRWAPGWIIGRIRH